MVGLPAMIENGDDWQPLSHPPQTDCVHVCTCVCWSSPVQSNPQQHQHNTAAPEGLKASIDRGSIQTLWGPSHSKSGVMEQEGEGAHFSPPGHRSFRRNCVCRGLTPSDAPIYTLSIAIEVGSVRTGAKKHLNVGSVEF